MQPWKKESKPPVVVPPVEDRRKDPIVVYKVFTCEMEGLELELNRRAHEIVDVLHIAHFGSAVKVVVKVR